MGNGGGRGGQGASGDITRAMAGHSDGIGGGDVMAGDQVDRHRAVGGQGGDIGQAAELVVHDRDVDEIDVAAIGDDDLVAEGRILSVATDAEGIVLEVAGRRGTSEDGTTAIVGGADHTSHA